MEIAAWLKALGLEQYRQAFLDHHIDAALLPSLDAADLREIGVEPLGHRKRMLAAIAAMAEATPPDPAPAGQAERRQLTLLFADLVGSTALSSQIDPEEMGEVLRAYQDAVAGAVARFGGHVAKLMGDGVLAYFGWPRAHDDSPEGAIRAGLDIVDGVPRLVTPACAPLAARVGIATGWVVVGDLVGAGAAREETVVGETPNLAARLQQIARPGTVAIAEGTRRLVGEAFRLRELGARRLKGFAQPVPVFEVVGEQADSRFRARQPGEAPVMVGRDRELAVLTALWREAGAGRGRTALLVGEAGFGKSRLVHALVEAAERERAVVLRFQCSPHRTGSPLWPVLRQIEAAAGFAAGDDDRARVTKLAALLRHGAGAGRQPAELIAPLLGIGRDDAGPEPDAAPQQRRAAALAALAGQLPGLAALRPVLAVVEDAHWIDPTSLELMHRAIGHIPGARILMVVTSRPENHPMLPAAADAARLTLNRLGRGATEAIVARLAGGVAIPDGLLDEILSRTDGVPLFVEEMTKAVLEGASSAGGIRTVVPDSLHDTLMARLDRVPDAKEVAQVASCIGREFAYPLLAAVSPLPEPALRAALDRLSAAELIFPQGRPPDATYLFKHALVRDAAHESLLRARRQELHARIGTILERDFPDQAATQPELLAYHYAAARQPEAAASHWSRAAQLAFNRSAMQEAIAHATGGLAELAGISNDKTRARLEANLQATLALAIKASRGVGHPDAERAFTRAHALSQQGADPALAFPMLFGLWHAHWFQGHLFQAEEEARQLLDLARADGSREHHVAAENALGSCLIHAGRSAAGLAHFERVGALYRSRDDAPLAYKYMVNFGVSRGFSTAMARLTLGMPDAALREAAETIAYARTRQPINLCAALSFGAHVPISLGDADLALAWAEECLAVAAVQGFEFMSAFATINRGWAHARRGRPGPALAEIRRGIEAWQRSGAGLWMPRHLLLEAEAAMLAGEPDAALARASEALELARATGQREFESPALAARGDALLARGDGPAADAAWGEAVEVARAQGALFWELRAACRLARHRQDRGEAPAAHALLAPLRAAFVEGAGTPALAEADAILAAASASPR